jgi:hypothetical protein
VYQTGVVYALLARYADPRRVREFYYCSSFYYGHIDLFDKYAHDLSWEVMNFARKCEKPGEVLQAAARHGFTLSELKQMFDPVTSDPETEKIAAKYPLPVRPVIRWLRDAVLPENWTQAQSLIDTFLGHVRELTEKESKDE